MALTSSTQADAAVAAMDALVSGLFDIQDDIDAAVVWLAENWSADLPAPAWYGRGDQGSEGEGLRLLVYCDDAELARVAELVGVAPVDDPGADSDGYRYRRVCHPFGTGRVELHAFTEIGPEADR